MTLYRYLFSIGFSTIVSWVAWFIVLFSVDPFEGSVLGLGIFYLSFWFAVTGTLALVGFFLRRIVHGGGYVPEQVVVAFRQGLLLALLLVVSMILQSLRILTWWNLAIFIVALALLELFFTSRYQHT